MRAYFKPLLLIFGLLSIAAGYLWWQGSETVNWSAFAAMAGFYTLFFGIGAYAAEVRKAKSGSQTDGMMLAGRSLPLWIAVFTMSATWVGGGFINGTAEYAASTGLIWVQAPWGYALSLIVGGLLFARKMRRMGFRTMLDPLEQRYGKRITALLFLPALSGELFWTAAILTALGATFGTVLGIDLYTAILLSAAIAIAYTAIGGLWSVALTDLPQLIILFLGLIIVVPFVLETGGGWDSVYTAYGQKFGAAASLLPSRAALGDFYWVWWDYALLLVFGGIPWQVYFQRVLASKDAQTALRLSLLAGVVCLAAAVAPTLIGMSVAVIDWSALSLSAPPDASASLPWAIRYLTTPWVATLGLGAVAAAVMSSVDSSILSASSMSAWNVYRPLIKPNISDKNLSKVIRRCIYIIGIVATLMALRVSSVYELWFLCSDFVYCLLFPALLCAMFDPKANAPGALAGFVVAAFLRFGGGDTTLGIAPLLPYPTDADGSIVFPFRTLAMMAGLLSIVIVSRLSQTRWPARPLFSPEPTHSS